MMTPRIRSVKPILFSHEGLFEIEMKYQLPLRLAYISLFTCCDREGRFRWQPVRLKLHTLPYDKADIAQVLDLFLKHGYIKKYQVKGELYGCIPTWLEHQKIKKELPSTLPSIDEAEYLFFYKNNEITIQKCPVIDVSSVSRSNVDHKKTLKKTNVDHKETLKETKVDHKETSSPEGREGKGREGKGKEGKGYIVESKTRRRDDDQPIENIFEHWKMVMGHPTANLDDKRKGIIGKALKFGYSVAELCDAITGCSITPHNIGDNDRGQRYDGLHVILRDADQIDRFIRNCQRPPRALTEADRRSQANVQTLQGWMQRTLAEEEAHASA